MHGNCCHIGAANDAKRNSYTIHAPVEFELGFTFNCENQILVLDLWFILYIILS